MVVRSFPRKFRVVKFVKPVKKNLSTPHEFFYIAPDTKWISANLTTKIPSH